MQLLHSSSFSTETDLLLHYSDTQSIVSADENFFGIKVIISAAIVGVIWV